MKCQAILWSRCSLDLDCKGSIIPTWFNYDNKESTGSSSAIVLCGYKLLSFHNWVSSSSGNMDVFQKNNNNLIFLLKIFYPYIMSFFQLWNSWSVIESYKNWLSGAEWHPSLLPRQRKIYKTVFLNKFFPLFCLKLFFSMPPCCIAKWQHICAYLYQTFGIRDY